ncbi:hypothetical protein AK812_SmicGene3346 [Symbiodinium microadriaticum]|uniref:Uncharacterized protein n=1 Tax=Symbiodinium microadriaticum TaxID=2951 RepID=A0A1Q9EZB1_SYMMI|nr:hypothetical protein AK812_SmicGene3346 [Symbiodinium microadriaticum]CAE7226444.1 unnamed protein product [Symbiodinium microadriaticum]
MASLLDVMAGMNMGGLGGCGAGGSGGPGGGGRDLDPKKQLLLSLLSEVGLFEQDDDQDEAAGLLRQLLNSRERRLARRKQEQLETRADWVYRLRRNKGMGGFQQLLRTAGDCLAGASAARGDVRGHDCKICPSATAFYSPAFDSHAELAPVAPVVAPAGRIRAVVAPAGRINGPSRASGGKSLDKKGNVDDATPVKAMPAVPRAKAAAEQSDAEKPAAEKPDTDKPDEKPDAEKPSADKPAAEKPAEPDAAESSAPSAPSAAAPPEPDAAVASGRGR